MKNKIKNEDELVWKEAQRLFKKHLVDFEKNVQGNDLATILLKGHLLIEHYLDHIMVLLFDKEAKVHSKSFHCMCSFIGFIEANVIKKLICPNDFCNTVIFSPFISCWPN